MVLLVLSRFETGVIGPPPLDERDHTVQRLAPRRAPGPTPRETTSSDMADKKPVWVDEDAHGLLKAYAKQIKKPMVEVASRLVLDRLEDLEGAESADEPVAAAPEPVAEEAAPAPVADPGARAARRRAARPAPKRPSRPDPEDDSVRYLGGVWLV